MRLLLGLALRNLSRNKMRTAISGVAVVAGVFVLIFGFGLVAGLDENVIRAQEDGLAGHVLMRPEGYPTDGLTAPLEETQVPSAELLARLADDRVSGWAPRLWFTTRVIAGSDSLRARGLGYDPTRDPQVYPREGWKIEGALPADRDHVALGCGLASLLDLKPESPLTLESRTRAGAINALQFTVSGVVCTQNPALDNQAVWMPMETAEALVISEGAFSHVGVRLRGGRGAADEAERWLAGAGWVPITATHEVADLLALNDIRRRAISMVVIILMLSAAVGIANTVIMATYERIREIGTLRAMGMTPGAVRALFLVEGAAMGALSGLVGAVAGAGVVGYFAKYGIDLTKMAGKGDLGNFSLSTMLYLHLSWPVVFGSATFGAIIAMIASIYPANHAATLNPADAVRAD